MKVRVDTSRLQFIGDKRLSLSHGESTFEFTDTHHNHEVRGLGFLRVGFSYITRAFNAIAKEQSP